MKTLFSRNNPSDDIAVLTNLICQMMDEIGGEPTASVMDDTTKTEYGVSDILNYIRGKYGKNF